MNDSERFDFFKKHIALLERAVHEFNRALPQPEFSATLKRFRYKNPTPLTFLVLKMSRIVAGLYAMLTLTKSGLFQDAGGVCRVIYECIHDIEFIMDGLTKDSFPPDKQEVVDNFFKKEISTPEAMLNTMSKSPTIPRKKIYPTVGRFLSPQNPDRPQRIVKVLEEVMSGYIHAAYSHIMEMYEGISKTFKMSGAIGRISAWTNQIALITHSALNDFSILARELNLSQLEVELISARNELEYSDVYKSI